MHLGTGEGVELLVESETTSKVTHTEYQQNVGEDGSDHTGLDDIDISLDQCENGDQQLDHVTEGQPRDKDHGTTYPKVAFKRPPHASPNRSATSSVAKASPPASGSTLNRQAMNTTTSDWPVLASAQAMGSRTGAAQMIGHPLIVFCH